MNIDSSSDVRDRDPVCGMNVRVDVALQESLVADHEHHTYYFCRAGCREEFLSNPATFISSHGQAAEGATASAPDIDDGMRLWYESCSCCLSDAYPDVKATLDAERAASAQPIADAGICEVAEAAEAEKANV